MRIMLAAAAIAAERIDVLSIRAAVCLSVMSAGGGDVRWCQMRRHSVFYHMHDGGSSRTNAPISGKCNQRDVDRHKCPSTFVAYRNCYLHSIHAIHTSPAPFIGVLERYSFGWGNVHTQIYHAYIIKYLR